ncbi:hypothetical protein AB0424_28690 [Streptomyces sp. NPDC051180]|uniref:hypothetical protein n=1 Tax=unclassified Streptomyces TaxID=2593676 RepID=UPI00344CCB74
MNLPFDLLTLSVGMALGAVGALLATAADRHLSNIQHHRAAEPDAQQGNACPLPDEAEQLHDFTVVFEWSTDELGHLDPFCVHLTAPDALAALYDAYADAAEQYRTTIPALMTADGHAARQDVAMEILSHIHTFPGTQVPVDFSHIYA